MSNKLKMESPVSPGEMAIENTGYRTKTSCVVRDIGMDSLFNI